MAKLGYTAAFYKRNLTRGRLDMRIKWQFLCPMKRMQRRDLLYNYAVKGSKFVFAAFMFNMQLGGEEEGGAL
jgi:hypothetical protein